MIDTKVKKFVYMPTTPVGTIIADLYRKDSTIALICNTKGVLLGIATLSDIKQALLRGVDRQAPVSKVMKTEYTFARKGTSEVELKKLATKANPLKTGKLRNIPIIDEKKHLIGLYRLPNGIHNEKTTVLVTGGAGYIGSHLCRLLLKEGYRVVVLDKLLFGDAGVKELRTHPDFSLIHGDIGDIGTLINAIQKADAVVHLAGIVGDPASALNPVQTMEENHFATKMLIDLAEHYQVSRFVFASSCSVYGASDVHLDETSELNPVSLYAQSKVYSERELLKAAGEYFSPVILRFGTVYGLSPRMRFDLVVNTMTAHGYFNKKITVDGGAQWRPLLHVEDAARACLAVLQAPLHKVSGQIFNVGDSNENYQIAQIAKHVGAQLPRSSVTHLDTVKDLRNYHVSFKKINKNLGFKTKHSLKQKIADLIREFKRGKFKDWKDKRYSNYLTLRNELEKVSVE